MVFVRNFSVRKNCLLDLTSGGVRGGSEGSADPPKILEPIEKKLENEHSDPPRLTRLKGLES